MLLRRQRMMCSDIFLWAEQIVCILGLMSTYEQYHYRQTYIAYYKSHLDRQWNCWSHWCSWSCSNYIFILVLTMDWAHTTATRDEKHLGFGFFRATHIRGLTVPFQFSPEQTVHLLHLSHYKGRSCNWRLVGCYLTICFPNSTSIHKSWPTTQVHANY